MGRTAINGKPILLGEDSEAMFLTWLKTQGGISLDSGQWNTTEYVKKLANYIRDLDADVLCFQEWYDEGAACQEFKQILLNVYGFSEVGKTDDATDQVCIMSKSEITGVDYGHALENPGCAFLAVRTNDVTVVNVHMPNPNPHASKLLEDKNYEQLQREQTWEENAKRVGFEKVNPYTFATNQYTMFKNWLEWKGGTWNINRLVVAGDFNDITENYTQY